LGGIEARALQRRRPILTKVDADRTMLGAGYSAEFGQCGGLEFDDLGLIDFVECGPGRPGKRYGRESSPDATITTWRRPVPLASAK
jgi:hypothetical protein